MKSIILAAGEGTRLRPLTNEIPKALVSFHGRSLLDYQIETLHSCEINNIVVVCGYRGDKILRKDIKLIENKEYLKTNMLYSLFCAEDEMNSDLIISYGDIVYSKEILMSLIMSKAPYAITVDLLWRELWEMRMSDPLMDAESLKMNDKGYIVELGKQPESFDDIQGQYMGLIKIAFPFVKKIISFYHSLIEKSDYKQKILNMHMTDFLQLSIDAGFPLFGVPVYGGWVEIDSISDLKLPLNGVKWVE